MQRIFSGHRDESVQKPPVETIEYHLPNEEQVYPCCHGTLHERLHEHLLTRTMLHPATTTTFGQNNDFPSR
ncbi:hypothetical protein COD09_13580 [Bacillus cereus]|uniref:Uncharacterized protein n=1 Tax=Bacillus cereus TaxID=1396 RepID=A0A2C1DNR0_BACCE|nr:hypothetical protein COD09_13580 [Bacillus cereus]